MKNLRVYGILLCANKIVLNLNFFTNYYLLRYKLLTFYLQCLKDYLENNAFPGEVYLEFKILDARSASVSRARGGSRQLFRRRPWRMRSTSDNPSGRVSQLETQTMEQHCRWIGVGTGNDVPSLSTFF